MNEYGLKCIKRIAAVVISAGAGVNIFRIYMKYFTEKNIPYFEYIEQYGHALLGISLFLIIYICCRNIKNNRIFDLSDKYSYYVYIVHQLFILSPFGLMTATSNLYLNWILVLVAIVVSAFVLKIVSDKANALTGKVETKICNRIGTGQFL
jgi:peptidoglycan/LPS O-acetylase OafA/YrhL